MKYHEMQTIKDYIYRNYIQDEFELKEVDTNNGYSTKRYSLYHRGILISSFTDDNSDSGMISEAYQYFLGYLDAYLSFNEIN